MADALLLRQVLQNLLDNSLKYIKDEQKPPITIVARHLDRQKTGNVRVTGNSRNPDADDIDG